MDEPFLPEWFWDDPPEATPPKVVPPREVKHVPINFTIGSGWGDVLRPLPLFLDPALWQDLKDGAGKYQGGLKNLAGSLKSGFTRGELVDFGIRPNLKDIALPNLELGSFFVHDEVQVLAAGEPKGIHQMPAPMTDQELKLRVLKGRTSPKTITLPKVTPAVFPKVANLDPSDKFVEAIVATLKAADSMGQQTEHPVPHDLIILDSIVSTKA